MTISSESYLCTRDSGLDRPLPINDERASLVLVFGGREILHPFLAEMDLKKSFPNAIVAGCSTSGEIRGTDVSDEQVVVTAISFEDTELRSFVATLDEYSSSYDVGSAISKTLSNQDLKHIFVLSDGLSINGSALVSGLTTHLSDSVAVTGGLAGDGDRFEKTFIIHEGKIIDRGVVGIGLYGSSLEIGYGSLGGWDSFGPERVITQSRDNVLYQLDGRSALEMYKEYLGPHAKQLPSSGLLFPLAVRKSEDVEPLVRTILSIDEAAQSISFAGDMPEGYLARFMKANVERLVDGAADAAGVASLSLVGGSVELAILISCVGRKLVLKQRVEEEVEEVSAQLGTSAALTGFYSYGEIAPFIKNARCELHNQTMTITAFRERAQK